MSEGMAVNDFFWVMVLSVRVFVDLGRYELWNFNWIGGMKGMRWINGGMAINEDIAYSKVWLCNLQDFLMKYYPIGVEILSKTRRA